MQDGATTASDPTDHAAHDEELGNRIRTLRRQRRLTLQDLATNSGLSTSMLSLIERGQATPSIRSLRSLGAALGVPIAWFFTAPEPPRREESPYIVRARARRLLRLTSTHIQKQLLSPDTAGAMEMYEIVIERGGSSGPEFAGQHGEKAGLVLSGTLRLWLGEQAHLLVENDSFRFPATVPHRFDNPGDAPAKILWIVDTQAVAGAGGRTGAQEDVSQS